MAPGFLEWQQAEQERIIASGIKRAQLEAENKVRAQEKLDMENGNGYAYYKRIATEAHTAWAEDNFKKGPLREAYMEAAANLATEAQKNWALDGFREGPAKEANRIAEQNLTTYSSYY